MSRDSGGSRYTPTPAQHAEYHRLAHALQSGVMAEHDLGSDDGSPKHLRVGVNLRAVEVTALVRLLVDAGVISMDAYFDTVNQQLLDEVRSYEQRLSRKFNKPVRLV